MRAIRFIILSVIVVLALGSSVGAQAEVDESDFKAVYPNLIDSEINAPCPRGSDKIFRAEFVSPRHTRVVEYGPFILVTTRGNELSDEGYKPPQDRRHVEYNLFPRSRKAKIDIYDMRNTLAYIAHTGNRYTFKLWSDCIEKLPDME